MQERMAALAALAAAQPFVMPADAGQAALAWPGESAALR